MADLLDIAPTTAVEVVRINGQRVVVHGLNLPAVAAIVARYPNIAGLLLGLGGTDVGPRFFSQFGAATGAIIAAGCGHLGDEQYEQYANSQFNLEDQAKLTAAVITATCPNGIGFFVELVTKLTTASGEAKPVRVRLKKSPLPSPSLSDVASRPIMQ